MKKEGGIIESDVVTLGDKALEEEFRLIVVEKVAWPTTNLHIRIKSKVSLHVN